MTSKPNERRPRAKRGLKKSRPNRLYLAVVTTKKGQPYITIYASRRAAEQSAARIWEQINPDKRGQAVIRTYAKAANADHWHERADLREDGRPNARGKNKLSKKQET